MSWAEEQVRRRYEAIRERLAAELADEVEKNWWIIDNLIGQRCDLRLSKLQALDCARRAMEVLDARWREKP